MKKRLITALAFLLALIGVASFSLLAPTAQAEVEKRYLGGTAIANVDETIYYTRREVNMFVHNTELPAHISQYTCGINAGGNIVGWYNKDYPEMIPGHAAGYLRGGRWYWNTPTAPYNAMYDDLFVAMGGNPNGVTINEYTRGLLSYTRDKDMLFTLQNVRGNDNWLIPIYKTYLQSNRLISVFLNSYNLGHGVMTPQAGKDTINFTQYDGRHVVVAYGYAEISYFDSQNTMFREDTYLLVASGFVFPRLAWLRTNTNCIIEGAIAMKVY